MRELGKSSERYHREIGAFAPTCGLDALVCVGEQAALIAGAAVAAGMSADVVHHYPDAREAANALPPSLHAGDLVLLKASRGIHLEAVAQAVRDLAEAADADLAPPRRKVAG
jgi:UDP-N-acetylmuramoyl-tripeptide--D-alanyl-D-alanine ligase